MNRFVQSNNTGADQLENGMYAEAVDSFTRSLRIVKDALAVYATAEASLESLQDTQRYSPVVTISVQEPERSLKAVEGHYSTSSKGLFRTPLRLVDFDEYQSYKPTVEASVAIMLNLALAHHLNALYGPSSSDPIGLPKGPPPTAALNSGRIVSTLDHAITLYELAYSVQMQEGSEMSVEFIMAMINNLGHAHRSRGDEEKSNQCFRHLLSTILFVQSYGPSNFTISTELFVYSISHLILRSSAAPAA
jgi:hypothetical protein